MSQARSLYHESTVQSADSIESHPNQTTLFALGTYQVDQREGTDTSNSHSEDADNAATSSSSPEYSRKGILRLKQFQKHSDKSFTCDTLSEIETAAILDMKWLHPSSSYFSIALANSQVSLYSYTGKSLEHVKSVQINSSQALCLSIDWSDRVGNSIGGYNVTESSSRLDPHAIVSQSDGSLAHVSNFISNSPIIETWKAHDYEAWTTAYDCWSDGNVVWSGGDDLSLKGWDLRTECIDEERVPIFTSKKCFEGGVTSMQSHHLRQYLWAVGSYDGQLRLFDARQPLRALSTTQAGGGIWRIKWHPSKANRLLLGCMHDGFKVMHLDSLLSQESDDKYPHDEMQLHTRFDEHKSLAYGCDWDRGDATLDCVYSCSFYDSTLHAWQCD